ACRRRRGASPPAARGRRRGPAGRRRAPPGPWRRARSVWWQWSSGTAPSGDGGTFADLGPPGAARELPGVDGGGVHLRPDAWPRGGHVATPLDADRVGEVLVQVVDELDGTILHRSGHGRIIEEGEVLDELAQADAAGVRADRDTELGRQQHVRDVLVRAGHARGVDLHDVDRAGLEELLEHDAVRDGLTGGDLDGRHAPADVGVAEDVVGGGRLLDPVGLELGESAHPLDGLADLPALVGVDADADVRADGFAGQPHPVAVLLEVAPDLELDHAETVGDRLPAEPDELVVAVAEPSGRVRVGGVAVRLQLGDALGFAGRAPAEDVQGLVLGQGVTQMLEVD